MRIFFDTSVLVAALILSHVQHGRAKPWLDQVQNGTNHGLVSAHSLAELYAILTRYPIRPSITSERAHELIAANILAHFEVIALSEQDYRDLLAHVAGLGLTGGAVYDALHMHAAAKVNPDRIVTFNEADFRRVYPALADRVVAP
jgi:predicted nucleic acid-binding protein